MLRLPFPIRSRFHFLCRHPFKSHALRVVPSRHVAEIRSAPLVRHTDSRCAFTDRFRALPAPRAVRRRDGCHAQIRPNRRVIIVPSAKRIQIRIVQTTPRVVALDAKNRKPRRPRVPRKFLVDRHLLPRLGSSRSWDSYNANRKQSMMSRTKCVQILTTKIFLCDVTKEKKEMKNVEYSRIRARSTQMLSLSLSLPLSSYISLYYTTRDCVTY